MVDEFQVLTSGRWQSPCPSDTGPVQSPLLNRLANSKPQTGMGGEASVIHGDAQIDPSVLTRKRPSLLNYSALASAELNC